MSCERLIGTVAPWIVSGGLVQWRYTLAVLGWYNLAFGTAWQSARASDSRAKSGDGVADECGIQSGQTRSDGEPECVSPSLATFAQLFVL